MGFVMRIEWLVLFTGIACSATVYAVENQQVTQPDDGFQVATTDWPWWRGPMRDGTADQSQKPPTEFNSTKNLVWSAKIPGRGYGSPTIFGKRVFLATCDEVSGAQSVMCYAREDGTLLWNTVVHEKGALRKNEKSTGASSTPACDGERVFINFPNNDTLVTTALDLNGKRLWQREISHYEEHQGYGASPALYQDLVIVTSDNKAGGAIVAMQRDSGEIVWKRDRPAKPNYPSPIIVHAAQKDQIILVGCDQVVSYDPLSGDTLWETEGATTECVTSTLTNGELIYTSGGYPDNHMSAIKADGSREIVWRNDTRLYVPSLVQRDGFLYGVLDAGIAMCWNSKTGQEMWKKRLGGTFSASATLAGDLVYIPNEGGEFFVFKAIPDRFELVAKNKVGEEVLATPVIVGGRIYYRALAEGGANRQEMLYCFGAPPKS
jgi:outer membrane protein assembly factor BamB